MQRGYNHRGRVLSPRIGGVRKLPEDFTSWVHPQAVLARKEGQARSPDRGLTQLRNSLKEVARVSS